jgi:hypothetical protein
MKHREKGGFIDEYAVINEGNVINLDVLVYAPVYENSASLVVIGWYSDENGCKVFEQKFV